MPPDFSFPGVYIQELPAGVHTIPGVPTSITAFIGRARRGPVESDAESPINSFADFERRFGGLWKESALGFAVRDFFLNGGSQALVVRLYHAVDGINAKARLNAGSLQLEAAYPGAWANKLRARIEHPTTPLPDGSINREAFHLSIRDGETGNVEFFKNLSIKGGAFDRVDKVLADNSKWVRAVTLPRARPRKHAEPANGQDVWDDHAIGTYSKVSPADEASDGAPLQESDFTGAGKESANEGLYALNKVPLLNLLCIPGYKDTGSGFDVDKGVISNAATYCEARRAMLLLDSPAAWRTAEAARTGIALSVGTASKNAALFFPRLRLPNPERNNQKEDFGASGAVAGVFARTDAQRGVWKAPAGMEATLLGEPELSVLLRDAENDELFPLGVNCLRSFRGVGKVVWGARTLAGVDAAGSDWKYIPVRRTALFIEESLYDGTKWIMFEPNGEPLWAQIRLNIGAFMHRLFKNGAFQGQTPRDAYFVKCDTETTTQDDIDLGVVNIIVGFAPLKPAEFVVIKIQQMAGRTESDINPRKIDPAATWHDLVLPALPLQMLHEIASQLRHQTKDSRGPGITALFAGPSGTGKTMAAEVLANHLRLDLYPIDLSAVVNKFIGETEKNLRRVFDAAEAGGAILLFEEADALFGKRTEAKDSHDRFANSELSYLLQRLEEYGGLAILTTNHKENIDTAFLRRLRFIVEFPIPDAEHRSEIWRRIFPATTPTGELDFAKLSRLNIAGGNIRNVALSAASLAAEAAQPVGMTHLLRAVQSEYLKLEKPLPGSEVGDWA